MFHPPVFLCEGGVAVVAPSAAEQTVKDETTPDSDSKPSTTTAGGFLEAVCVYRGGCSFTHFCNSCHQSLVSVQTERHISIQTKLEGLEMLVDLNGGEFLVFPKTFKQVSNI